MERKVSCRVEEIVLREQKKHLVDVGVPGHGPGEGAGPGHGLADVHLAAARLPHLHLHRAVRGDVLTPGQMFALGWPLLLVVYLSSLILLYQRYI